MPAVALNSLNLNRSGSIITNPTVHPAFSGRTDVLSKFDKGFAWDASDGDVTTWIPQGITGNADRGPSEFLNGKKWLLVSWHYEGSPDKGVRVSFIDVTSWSNPVRYRHVLLVTPNEANDLPTFDPVPIHAGGIVWYGRYLYVADTDHGFRVFDTLNIMEVSTGQSSLCGWIPALGEYHAFDYRYILPQVGKYERPSGSTLKFSFCGLDRGTTPPRLISGEYWADGSTSRLLWWPFDTATCKLVASWNLVGASYGRLATDQNIQGIHSWNSPSAGGKVWLSRTGAGDKLTVYTMAGSQLHNYSTWVRSTEGLTYSQYADNLWGLAEEESARSVFCVNRGDVD